ncbi:MAG TPA: DNA-directed RNA polymerase subunit B'' [Candidatus Nanoarchaeia archaeon]|nr:DNA-directed RNA polymerase subunit B'' [Candidatus Nanoarchaeia archaeon]
MTERHDEILIRKFFEENSFVASNIESFNNFVKNELQKIVDENRIVEPTIIPQNVEDFKIRLDKVWVTKPEITEADGSKRPIYPNEARLRKISYAAPIFMEISAHINDIQRESFTTQIGNLPIMLKSEYCHLNKMTCEQLIEHGEDPDDPGNYFIINGTEKVLIDVEDLSSNRFFVDLHKSGPSKAKGSLFSERGSYKIPHSMEQLKDGLFYLSFTRMKKIPLVLVIKALGLLKDEEIMKGVSRTEQFDEVLVNLFEYVDVKTEDDAVDHISKAMGLTQTKEIRMDRVAELLDRYLLPHIGLTRNDRMAKAQNLCKMLRKYILVVRGIIGEDDKDHYMNKRLKLAGDLLGELFRVNLKILIGDLLYNFQRIVKRGKFPSLKVIIREKLLTSRIYSAMATGAWVGGRKGIAQRIQRMNYLQTLSHLQRVVSPLSTTQENFEARYLHPTHLGRLCPAETPEGTNIGLRKNLSLLAEISQDSDEQQILATLKTLGLKRSI